MNESNRARALQQIAEHAVSDELDLWPTIEKQIDLTPGIRPRQPERFLSRKGWRRSIGVMATAAALLVAIGVTSPLWNHPQTVSAQAILDRAQATANDASLTVTTYHLKLTRQVPMKGNATITTELWYGGKDRQRSDHQIADGVGGKFSTDDAIFNGAQTWLVTETNGQTQVVHTTGTTWNSPVDDPTKQTSLADVLNQYNNDKSCMTAASQGEATVANRKTYVIVLSPKLEGCGSKRDDTGARAKAGTPSAKEVGAAKASQAEPENQIGKMTVWVDEQSFLPLRTEVLDPSGVVLDRTEVTAVEYNIAIPDATFTYTPPAGATVLNFTGGSGADVKRALDEQQGGPKSAPTKAP